MKRVKKKNQFGKTNSLTRNWWEQNPIIGNTSLFPSALKAISGIGNARF
jgi:hypothetical protein